MDSIINFFSVAPDSFAPLKHTSAINLIFWVALSLFFFENALIMLFQFGMRNISKYIPFNLTGGITTIINNLFRSTGFPLIFAQLIKPCSSFLYIFVFILIMIYGSIVSLTNLVLSLVTTKRLDI